MLAVKLLSTQSSKKKYRYFRVYCTALSSGTQLAMTETDLLGLSGNISSPTTVVTSSSGSSSGSPSNLVSENFNSWVSSDNAPIYIYYDILNPEIFTGIYVRALGSIYTNQCMKDFTVEGSQDNSSWDLLLTVSNQINWTSNEGRTFNV